MNGGIGLTDRPLLQVEDVVVRYRTSGRREDTTAVDGVSLTVDPSMTLGLVGESGSGKSSIGRAVLGLAPVASGSIRFDGQEITHLADRRAVARELQVIFQDPYRSLNPALTIGSTLAEPLRARGMKMAAALTLIRDALDSVQLPQNAIHRMPHEFSGGQRQRIAIARAIVLKPRLIVCDEPVSALDLSTQAVVLELLREIQQATGVAYLFISHDLDVVRYMSRTVAVMKRGRIVEQGPAEVVTLNPSHPYTQALLLASPVADPVRQAQRRALRASSVRGPIA